MGLSIPLHIQKTNIQDNAVHYKWDDDRTLPTLKVVDKKLISQLKGISQRAIFAFMCGTAEWICWRLAKLSKDLAPRKYLEAAWALIVDPRYCGYGTGTWWQMYAEDDKSWFGPIKGPIGDVLERLEIAFQQLYLERTDPVRRAGLISTLATYVMTDPSPYKTWCKKVMERFGSLYPRDPEDILGDVVPRQAVDPEFDFHIEQTEALINQFLESLKYRSHGFLSSPKGMLECCDVEESRRFRGTPYVFNMEADRRARRGL